jgi:DNA-binding MarR family transcriptional regulator
VAVEVEHISRVLGVVYRHSLDYMNATMLELGLSALESAFLVSILVNEGINQEQLSALLAIDKSATAKAMKSMEAKGFVKREQSADDKRAKRVFSTERGRRCRDSICAKVEHYISSLASDISPEDFEATLRTLTLMADRMIALPASAMSRVGPRS